LTLDTNTAELQNCFRFGWVESRNSDPWTRLTA